MALQTAVQLTGEDLTIDDVWSVAVERMPATLTEGARAKIIAARELVERTLHGKQEHTYGINTGFGRFVSKSTPQMLVDRFNVTRNDVAEIEPDYNVTPAGPGPDRA